MAGADDGMCRPTLPLDLRSYLVFEDEKAVGTGVFFSKKSFDARMDGTWSYRRKQVIAVTDHERGTEKKSWFVRFIYFSTISVPDAIKTWIAFPRFSSHKRKTFFGVSKWELPLEDGRISMMYRLRTTCDFLTRTQRCADWLILRQLRVPGTIVGSTLFTIPAPPSSSATRHRPILR